jgi:hypothetical protein
MTDPRVSDLFMDTNHPRDIFCPCDACRKHKLERVLLKTSILWEGVQALEWPEDAKEMNPLPSFSIGATVVARLPKKKET